MTICEANNERFAAAVDEEVSHRVPECHVGREPPEFALELAEAKDWCGRFNIASVGASDKRGD
jgi:hypothetical protein